MHDAVSAPTDKPDGAVRTPEFPRRFDWNEFWRGAFFAWAAFQPVGIGLLAWSGHSWAPLASAGPVELIAAATYYWLIGGVISTAFVALLGSAPAFLIGYLLRRVHQDWIHLTAFATYGLLLGYATMWALTVPSASPPALFGLWSPACTALAAGAAVVLGWLITSRRALVADQKRQVP